MRVSLIKELKRLVNNKAFLEKNRQWLASLRILLLLTNIA
ncbi:hypothetical protein AD01_0173 [Escherichia coli 2-427-07_S4_C2]|nr:hypothetical protein EcoM_00577 [Escherichia coli WV_060327]EGH38668.1 hypothetical protein ECAA86_00445 [Escherichia coli AA86]EHU28929.1 hypothetical protein ECDEC1D_0712 [Escherichia coli DEC1D]EKI32016.1 hypothetical protein ECARS42123_0410 [Escherichia coli ARS4.2123]EKI45494.1 hypothetical protein EC07798_0491 [Escherichia coli 07798]KDY48686.1 hypothetical protein AD01_0173 [Escherichia coli 2-427-07_S4_C2]KDZ53927.1 hypothetical protein AB16_0811 [Escherichia coli 3-073-06_S1_C1]K